MVDAGAARPVDGLLLLLRADCRRGRCRIGSQRRRGLKSLRKKGEYRECVSYLLSVLVVPVVILPLLVRGSRISGRFPGGMAMPQTRRTG